MISEIHLKRQHKVITKCIVYLRVSAIRLRGSKMSLKKPFNTKLAGVSPGCTRDDMNII